MITLERYQRVATLTLNRPSRRNALASEMVAELDRALTELDADRDVGAIVLAGAAPAFCAGSDLKELGAMDVAGMAHHEAATAAVARKIGLLDTPVLVAVEGYALGGGFILAASCDLVIASEESAWNLAEVPNGWLPPWGLQALVSRVGPVVARRLTWGHERLSGSDVFRLGVADYCVPSGSTLGEATQHAKRISELPWPAVAATKRFFQSAVQGDGESSDAAANRIFIENCEHEEAKKTLARFGAKV